MVAGAALAYQFKCADGFRLDFSLLHSRPDNRTSDFRGGSWKAEVPPSEPKF